MKLKLGTKINIMVTSIILVLSTVIGFVVHHEITQGVKEFAVEKAKGDLALAYRYIDTHYPGNWEIKDDKLYKGSVLMNDNFDLVDTIGRDTGDTVTIFQGNTRVATNVIKEGNRAVGTTASPEVTEAVITKGETFYGEADVVGQMYQTAYMPIKDGNNQTIGIFYVGASQNIINKIISSFFTTFLPIIVLMIVIAGTSVFVFTAKINKRLRKITEGVKLAGNGDFTSTIDDKAGDELSTLSVHFNDMTKNLKEMMNEVMNTSEQVAASSEELTASAEQTSKASETIAESIQEVASGADGATTSIKTSAISLEEVSLGIQDIVKNANTISKVSLQATSKANNGGELVTRTVQQIEAISSSVKSSGEAIKSLDQRSKEIGDITNVISSIAEQTNLLALNAAIEAARAGEHGKGFAVVADEVRKLAEQSQRSSSQITALIQEIQKDMVQSNNSMKQVTVEVEDGLKIVGLTEQNFQEILEIMNSLTNQIKVMVEATDKVSINTDEVTLHFKDLTAISDDASMHSQNVAAAAEQQMASMEEISASAHALSNLAEGLSGMINRFQV
ncbi:methyl-accepting chemotaxis protein [Mangrovibacillus cuniculi]|uniref:Methyl-accepting chemotaxis protein n=1 Tax=Mangrovibacillus cuniculi TaxID=2593652 RepID=A0A7S8CCT5_9BACI|nr:methyl-accepting chemotaxis protein [Mangrovibacillus cuniculi]QPC47626.1 methyl-accepting chemotaxis protein [Mangrovibacillus cuniculi]